MRRPRYLLSAVILVLVALLSDAAAQTAPSTAGPVSVPPLSLSALIDQAIALFPKVDADVVEVQDRTLTLSVGRAAGVAAGLGLEVYREGREIKHPRTGAVLGRAEETIGRAVVAQVFDGYSTATYHGTVAVTAGDHARTPPGKVRITLVSLTSPGSKGTLVEAVTGELYEALNHSGRFSVALGEQLLPWIRQRGITPEQFIDGRGVAEVSGVFKVDNLMVALFKTVERKPFMEVRLFTADRSEAALTTAMFVPSSIKPVQAGSFSGSDRGQPTLEKKPRSLLSRLLGGDLEPNQYSSGEQAIPLVEVGQVDFIVAAMDVAVASADKIARVALTDGYRISVYRIENRALVAEWSYNARSLGRVFSLQLAELLGDGTLQVVVNRSDPRFGLNSSIVGLRNGKPTALVDQIDVILLAIDETGGGVKQTLWAQPYSPDAFFTKGRIDKMIVRDGALVRERSVPVPENFRATGAALASLTAKGQRVLAYIDEFNRLRVSSGTDEIWASSSQVGGGMAKVEVQKWIDRSMRSYFYQPEPNPLAIDLDGDGIQEVIIPQNQVEGMLMVVYRGPAGLRMQQINSGFEGSILALGGFASEAGGTPTLVAAVVRSKNFFKTLGSTHIIMTVAE